jgi:hypothetical protein
MKIKTNKHVKKIGVDELPKYSPWVKRLLQLEPFRQPVRNIDKIDAEYDKDKYAKLLTYAKEHPGCTTADIASSQSPSDKNMVCFSTKSELFLTTYADYVKRQDENLINTLAEPISRARIVVELGCGYGNNLSVLSNAFPNRQWLGGEYSNNAVELAARLFKNHKEIAVLPFNWYDSNWSILEDLPEKALVFTRHTIEQLPQAKTVIPTLLKYKNKIKEVVHLEPVNEFCDQHTTLGMMRKAYTVMNDYNTDLFTILKNAKVQILKTDTDIFGGNPLNPTSLIHWKFSGE